MWSHPAALSVVRYSCCWGYAYGVADQSIKLKKITEKWQYSIYENNSVNYIDSYKSKSYQ